MAQPNGQQGFPYTIFAATAIIAILIGGLSGAYISWRFDPIKPDLDSLMNRVDVLSARLNQTQIMLSTPSEDETELLEDISHDISRISEQIAGLESSLDALRNKDTEIVNQLNADKETILEELDDISADIEGIQSEIQKMRAEITYTEVYSSVVSLNIGVEYGPGAVVAKASGFVYNGKGHIVTNQHVVEGLIEAVGIEVIFHDGNIVSGDLVASDPHTDLAVIKVDLPEGIEPLPLGNSSEVRVGELVVSVGNPHGYGGSLTTGVVSQTHRLLKAETWFPIPGVIQFDAAINPGNSGGPLLNSKGEVIGVATAKFVGYDTEGMGFAIPSNIVRYIVSSLIDEGEFRHPYIGIEMKDISLKIKEHMRLNDTKGVLIVDVDEDSPAEAAGLRRGKQEIRYIFERTRIGGDVIIQIDDVMTDNMEKLVSYIDEHKKPGDVIDMTIVRDRSKMNVHLTLGEKPE